MFKSLKNILLSWRIQEMLRLEKIGFRKLIKQAADIWSIIFGSTS